MHVIAALPPAHRLGRRKLLEIVELEDEPLLLPQRGFGSREWFDVACDMAQIRPRVLLESAAPTRLLRSLQLATQLQSFPRMPVCRPKRCAR